VKLSTSNPALKVPSQVTILTGHTSADFEAVSTGVSQTAAVTITAAFGDVTKSATMTLYPAETGSQTSTQHKVQLGWSAPSASSDAIVGYNVYRATVGASSYALLNPTIDTVTTYTDVAVQSGSTYNYVVKAVDDKGSESSPSNSTQVTIP
jgi:fibronectin type 3 domain-containing protein